MVTKGIGIPIKLLHESEGHVVTVAAHVTTSAERTNTMLDAQVELKSGETYRGDLHDAEDNWNVQLTDVTATARDGKVSHLDHMFIRGSRIRFIIVPEMLKNAPMFKRIDPKHRGKNIAMGVGGRGRAAAARATLKATRR